jgi:hypothetical protein
MLGNMATFLILSITAAFTNDPNLIHSCYQIMHLISKTSMRASTIAATVTGIILSVLTKWGLFRFYWIIAKEGLTILLIFLNLWGMYVWTLDAITPMATFGDIFIIKTELWTGIITQIFSLLVMYVISVFKPWGKLKGIHEG